MFPDLTQNAVLLSDNTTNKDRRVLGCRTIQGSPGAQRATAAATKHYPNQMQKPERWRGGYIDIAPKALFNEGIDLPRKNELDFAIDRRTQGFKAAGTHRIARKCWLPLK